MLSLVEAYVGFDGLRFGVHWTEVVSVWFIVWKVVGARVCQRIGD